MCVCVCVCVCERERERESNAHDIFGMMNICRRLTVLQCDMCFHWKLNRRRPTGNEGARYRGRESSGGGVTDLRPMKEQDTGQGKAQGEESQTYGQ